MHVARLITLIGMSYLFPLNRELKDKSPKKKLTLCLFTQGQVTRAQEAEENYVIKRELAVVRQQCYTASESLEKAQDTIRELQQHKVTADA